MDLIGYIGAAAGLRRAVALLGPAGAGRLLLRGSQGSSTAFVTAALGGALDRPVLLVVAHLDDADEVADELSSSGVAAARLPALEVLPGETGVSLDLFAERLALIRRLGDATGPRVLVAPIQALMQPAPPPENLSRLALKLTRGERVNLTDVARWLEGAGYTRLDSIEEPGDFAVRGGILDVFPAGGATRSGSHAEVAATPVRVDFFGDEIDSIAEVDLDTMGSDRKLDAIELFCASLEMAFGGGDAGQSNPHTGKVAVDALGGTRGVSVLEYLPRATCVVLHETMEIVEQARGYFERATDARVFGPPAVLKLIEERFRRKGGGEGGGGVVEVNQFSASSAAGDATIDLPVSALPELAQDVGEAMKELAAMAGGELGALHGAVRVVVFCQNEGEVSRFRELVTEFAPEAREVIEAQNRYLHRGFIWQEPEAMALVAVPYHELLHRFERRRVGARRGLDPKLKAGRAMDTFLDFAVGDYVVHRDHGIAMFQGLTTMKPREVKRTEKLVLPSEKTKKTKGKGKPTEVDPDEGLEEFLVLEFAGSSKLYVPAAKIDQVQKYIGGFKGTPQLSALGGTRWQKQKESVAESVRDLAAEMLRVRAARETMPGVRFPGDTAWQKEFEAEFPYQETEDQLAAISEIKKDMMSERPMDRLLCGDVGYGKTEVAVRAAFKAAEFGKQVAVLVPTTVLAEQHERTFRSRFADYPFRVESLSRFKTDKEINETLAKVRKGQVDVVIGTHRLLSKDVRFADLGLVVIDEEQRFGVEHKERLLGLRMTVDVLTLSATPIPRTLHMSMLGLRDISSLTTAPVDRRGVVTEVIPYNPRRVQQAIERELAREGQCYFVHNRVYNIESVADNIQRMAPEAKILIGHGQMPDKELEKVMLAFMRGEADILVSTTIIESGIDIATANTMFINDADRFGLADLHQLRGRVGRYKHRAYCYMLLPLDRPVGEVAVKRLKAIEEFSMLGAGFKIAMRDLEIRGAGNILGPEQSGHIAAVGYEMYCQLLETAVKELKHEPTHVASQTSVEIGITGMIPKRYIASDNRRMAAYRRIAMAQSPDELRKIVTELKQAYGEGLPPATERLLGLAELRAIASLLNIRSIAVRGPDVLLRARPADAAPVALLLTDQTAATAGAAGTHVTVLPPKQGEEHVEVYFRPPSAWLEPSTLMGVLTRRLGSHLNTTAA